MRLALALWLTLAAPALRAQESPPPSAPPAPAAPADENDTPEKALQRARAAFDKGDWATVSRELVDNVARIEAPAQRADGYRILGIAQFYQGKSDAASAAFIEALTLDPDMELDPFTVSPRAIALFEQVKASAEEALKPIRERKRQEADERRKKLEQEANERRLREKEEEEKRLAALRPPPVLERRVVQREFWVSLLPFGVGQMQNGDQNLGTALATSQIIAGATSAGSALLIEALRDNGTGKFTDSNYQIAKRLQVSKWIGAGAFYGLWLFGAIHATLRYKPETNPTELVLPSEAVPGSAPEKK